MSIVELTSKLSNEQIYKLNEDLVLKLEQNKYNKGAPQKEVVTYLLEDEKVHFPFAYASQKLKLNRKERKDFPAIRVEFTGKLRDEQNSVREEAISIISKTGSVILSLHTGFGKTILSINLACKIRMKTLIIVNKIVLIKQWEDSILQFCPQARIQKLSTKCEFNDDCDFYIINATNVPKKKRNFFRDIGLCLVDECHLIMAESLSRSLQYVCPRYLIGLSATPYREDGLDPLINLYFGEDKIIRILKRNHTVYVVKTGFSPKMETTENGKLNWGILLDSQANDKDRNELIVKLSKKFCKRNILILTKRIEQGEYLLRRLREEGENVASLLGKQQDFDRETRILVATTSKAGTGFDFSKLDCLILASDLESYFIQALGRVLRRPDVEPIVFDLIDNNRILQKHWETRQKVYDEIGGNIKNYVLF